MWSYIISPLFLLSLLFHISPSNPSDSFKRRRKKYGSAQSTLLNTQEEPRFTWGGRIDPKISTNDSCIRFWESIPKQVSDFLFRVAPSGVPVCSVFCYVSTSAALHCCCYAAYCTIPHIDCLFHPTWALNGKSHSTSVCVKIWQHNCNVCRKAADSCGDSTNKCLSIHTGTELTGSQFSPGISNIYKCVWSKRTFSMAIIICYSLYIVNSRPVGQHQFGSHEL